MKWLFLLLLAANVALFIWGWEKERRTSRQVSIVESEIGDLVLLSEVPDDPVATTSGSDQAKEQEEPLSSSDITRPLADESADAIEPEAIVSGTDTEPETETSETFSEPLEPPPPPMVQTPILDPDQTKEPATAESVEPPVVQEQEPVSPKVERVCGVIGPAEDEDTARRIVASLVEQQIEATRRTEQIRRTVGYWVIIAPYGSQREAIAAVSELKQKGVSDLRRFYRGELKNGISLGMYRREKNAEMRRTQIVDKGFPAELLARNKKISLYFIDYQGDAPIVNSAQAQLREQFPDIAVKQESCPHIARPGGIF